MAVGAIVGGIVGGGIYVLASGEHFNTGDLAVAVGVGAVGGALIGTGFAAAQGTLMIAGISSEVIVATSIGAGAGTVSSQIGYTAAAGDNYKTEDMLISAGIGGSIGAVTGVGDVAAPSPNLAMANRIAANAAGSMLQYDLTESVHGNHPTAQGLVANGILGAATAGTAEVVSGIGAPSNRLPPMQRLYDETIVGVARNGFMAYLQQQATPPDNQSFRFQRYGEQP